MPKLTVAVSDICPKVKGSAASSLGRLFAIPEISEISSTLLQVLTDPSKGTVVVLESLIETELLNAIDAASLLIILIIRRSLRLKGWNPSIVTLREIVFCVY